MTNLIAYTVNGNVMNGTILYKTGQQRYSRLSIPTPYIDGGTVGKSFIVAEIGGKLRLITTAHSRRSI